MYDYVDTGLPTSIFSEQITSPIILKVDIGENADSVYYCLFSFTDSFAPINIDNIRDKEGDYNKNSNVRDIVIYKKSSSPDGQTQARFVIYHNGQAEFLINTDYPKFNNNDRIYIYINPEKHRIMYFKNGLQQSNVILDYTHTDYIPSSLYLLPPYRGGMDNNDYIYIPSSNYDTSLAGGNIIIPPANWQYA